MDAMGWITLILLGGILGLVGQGIRVIVGIKKANDKAAEEKIAIKDVFDSQLLLYSLLSGFVAGALAAITLNENGALAEDKRNEMLQGLILPVIAAGYAGTDFIEGFVKKHLPK